MAKGRFQVRLSGGRGEDSGPHSYACPVESPSPTVTARIAGPFNDSLRRRLGGLLVALGAAGVLGVALWLNPAPDGHGTHTQLGLPPCAWAVALNRPCPTCGMTTAFSFGVRGRLAEAFQAQPFGL